MSPKESVTNSRVVELIKDGVNSLGVRGLSRAVGISPAIITRYTQGKVGEPSQATLEKLASYFKVPVAWLQGHFETMSFENALMYREMTGSGEKTGWIPGPLQTSESDPEFGINSIFDSVISDILKKRLNSSDQETTSILKEIKTALLSSNNADSQSVVK